MKASFIAMLVGGGLLVSVSAGAAVTQDQAFALIKEKKLDCLSCHAVDKKIVGPAWKDVGAKYSAADKAKLVEKIKKGGSGSWGSVPMTPHPNASDEDLGKLVDFVLSLK